jgi:predicted RNA-binding Zn ribbon-like protein
MIRTLKNLQLAGGCLAFDFVNTVNTRKPTPEFEYLKTFEDFLVWSAKTAAVRGRRLKALREHASANPRAASAVLPSVIDARENLYRFFSAIARGKSPQVAEVNAFNKRLSLAFQRLGVRLSRAGAEVRFAHDEISLNEPLNVIIKSAFDILTQADFKRIKECPRCGWLFLDTSRNHRRRWCDMNVCGSREKALDYYYRKTNPSVSK